MPEHGHPAREVAAKRKTSEKVNVFHNLTHPLRPPPWGMRHPAASLRMEGGREMKGVSPRLGGTGAPPPARASALTPHFRPRIVPDNDASRKA